LLGRWGGAGGRATASGKGEETNEYGGWKETGKAEIPHGTSSKSGLLRP
jgi:hypothetical protein